MLSALAQDVLAVNVKRYFLYTSTYHLIIQAYIHIF